MDDKLGFLKVRQSSKKMSYLFVTSAQVYYVAEETCFENHVMFWNAGLCLQGCFISHFIDSP